MSSATSRALVALLIGSGAGSVAHADRPKFEAGLDLREVTEQQLRGAGDNVTYTEVSGNIGAQIKNRRITASGTYRLSYRIPEFGPIDKSFSQDGVARLQADLIDEWLMVDTGVLVTRSRLDPGGAAPQTNTANPKNLTQTYTTFVQPSIAHHIGKLGFAANYRYSFTKNEGRQQGVAADPFSNRFDQSIGQQANFSMGMEPGSFLSFLPLGWRTSVQYGHENESDLAKHTRQFVVTDELTLPISESLALVGAGGYERIRISERSPLLDPVTGFPIRDGNGRFLADPTGPRLEIYDMGGLIADGGVIWKPSSRTRLEARVGRRFGGLSVTGLLEMKPDRESGLSLIVTDGIETFGQGLTNGLAGLPPDINLGMSVDLGSSYQNCLFGKTLGSGRCIGGSLGQASAASYREKGISIIYTRKMRRWTIAASGGYVWRRYIDAPGTPFSLDGVVDKAVFGDLSLSGVLTRKSGVSFSFRGNLFKNGLVGEPDVTSGSFSTSYYRSFGRGIRLQANLSVDASKQDGITADVAGRADLGLHYDF